MLSMMQGNTNSLRMWLLSCCGVTTDSTYGHSEAVLGKIQPLVLPPNPGPHILDVPCTPTSCCFNFPSSLPSPESSKSMLAVSLPTLTFLKYNTALLSLAMESMDWPQRSLTQLLQRQCDKQKPSLVPLTSVPGKNTSSISFYHCICPQICTKTLTVLSSTVLLDLGTMTFDINLLKDGLLLQPCP